MDKKVVVSISILVVILIAVAVSLSIIFSGGENVSSFDYLNKNANAEKEVTAQKDSGVAFDVFFIKKGFLGRPTFVKRTLSEKIPPQQSFAFAVISLFDGTKEKDVYTAIPEGSDVISIDNKGDSYILDLSSSFESGSKKDLKLAVEQLTMTVKANADLPVYVTIGGKQKNTIGQGVKISQPIVPDNYVKK